jgi:hypothetical protein
MEIEMATQVEEALKADLAEYYGQRKVLEKERSAIDKKMAALEKEYSQVLEFAAKFGKKAPKPRRSGRPGQARDLILTVVRSSETPLKPKGIITGVKKAGGEMTEGAIRQQLMKMKKEGVLTQDKNRCYIFEE